MTDISSATTTPSGYTQHNANNKLINLDPTQRTDGICHCISQPELSTLKPDCCKHCHGTFSPDQLALISKQQAKELKKKKKETGEAHAKE